MISLKYPPLIPDISYRDMNSNKLIDIHSVFQHVVRIVCFLLLLFISNLLEGNNVAKNVLFKGFV